MGSEEQKLNEWFNGEKANGLVDFKVEMDARGLTREEICKAINDFNEAAKHATPINWKELEDGI
jgi:2,4-dienoyl-CoA reductase-like NADH-dependent reductase (Old Yellow Enzyme family)